VVRTRCTSGIRAMIDPHRRALPGAVALGLSFSILAAGNVAAQAVPPQKTDVVLDGRAPFSRMHAVLEKTIFKVDVLALDLCLDSTTAAVIGQFATGPRSGERDDSIARAVIGASRAIARIEFLRDISFSQFADGIGEEQKKAVEAGLLADSTHRMVADSLPHWFAFLENRRIRDGDMVFYDFNGDTLRTVFLGVNGEILMDRIDQGRERRTSVLATYVAPKSGFRRGLLQSLDHPNTTSPDTWACDVAPRPSLDNR